MADEERVRPGFGSFEFDLDDTVTPGGSVVYEYAEPVLHGPGESDPVLASELEHHIARHLGPVEEVFHEAFSEVVEVEVLRVDPTDERPFHVLVTCGMAQRPMAVPPGVAGSRYGELVLSLPVEWGFDDADVEGDAGWPVRLLQDLARLPHQYGTWLGQDHTVPHGDPAESYAPDTFLCGCILEAPAHLPKEFRRLGLTDGRSVEFLCVTPLYADEIDYKLSIGAEALMERFVELEISMVIDPARPCTVHPDLPGALAPPRSKVLGTPWWRQCN